MARWGILLAALLILGIAVYRFATGASIVVSGAYVVMALLLVAAAVALGRRPDR